jgi:hypothetical protein
MLLIAVPVCAIMDISVPRLRVSVSPAVVLGLLRVSPECWVLCAVGKTATWPPFRIWHAVPAVLVSQIVPMLSSGTANATAVVVVMSALAWSPE